MPIRMNEGRDAPVNVGILGIEFYTPQYYVDQAELEAHDGVSPGKYTKGLLQQQLGFCMSDEDVNSICLTVVDRLLSRTGVDRNTVGRIEVGSESHVDRAKSIKSVLMRLFPGNHSISGSDHLAACFGGTAALFSAINWIHSPSWDGNSLALVVAGDIAVYGEGPARATSGVGAVAMIIGPDAKIVVESEQAVHYSRDIYDFYKADMASEFPTVDGHLSIESYLEALHYCYSKFHSLHNPVHEFDYVCVHSPYCKMAMKASEMLTRINPKLRKEMVEPSHYLTSRVGNMYCASIFAGLISIIITERVFYEPEKSVLVFSYGSGSSAALFRVRLFTRAHTVVPRDNILAMLDDRRKISPLLFHQAINQRAKHFLEHSWTPSNTEKAPGVWYLTRVDELYRRIYEWH
jgi:hydroxymethylglutaryl-CoA synthase